MNPNSKRSGDFFGSSDYFSIFEDDHSNTTKHAQLAGDPASARHSKAENSQANNMYPLITSKMLNKGSTESQHNRFGWQKENWEIDWEQENAPSIAAPNVRAIEARRKVGSEFSTQKNSPASAVPGNRPNFQDEPSANISEPRNTAGKDSDKTEVARLQNELEKARGELAKMDEELAKTRTIQDAGIHVQAAPSQVKDNAKDITEEMASRLSAMKLRGGDHHSYPFGNGLNREDGHRFDGLGSDHGSLTPNTYQVAPGDPKYVDRQGWATPARSKYIYDPFNQLRTGQATLLGAPVVRPNNSQPSSLGSGYNQSIPAWNPQYSGPTTMSAYTTSAAPVQCSGFLTGGLPSANMARAPATTLSPMAAEFTGSNFLGASAQPSPWNASRGQQGFGQSTYMGITEPMNYRRLLDRNVSCNWKYIVDKIVCNNDQQASIFLQQKLKLSTPEHKYELVEAIIAQAYPLMINRFGNFLIQRCFEHGTSEQVVAIAEAIRGNTLVLSMDAFGCHVVQKAFDVVPEEYKAIMVHELLRRIPETVIHRYACHVWQKLFELRWNDSPPQIMKYVNEALRGMWHEVALGETGSLVVQNIFENCLEEDKRPCINEVLASIDIISHGQFGNWCIQHVCEHGAPADRSRAIEHVLRFATEYSTDQFASKVVEKCLKVAGTDFLDRYLEKICEAQPDRPRMPLIDIAGDQYGNYLVQFILVNADPQHRELVSQHVRKHMVSLRGSKFGSRVAMLCCNPTFSNRVTAHGAAPPNDRLFQPSGNPGMARNNVNMLGPFHR